MRITLGIGYDGSAYHGWQAQKELSETIQAKVELALSKVANHPVQIVCAGRTDAGVHAFEQVVHFDTQAKRSTHSWIMGTNRYLPPDITVYWATPISDEFHARFSAYARHYRYLIYQHTIRPTLSRRRVGWYYQPLDLILMQEALQCLLGKHDFQYFRGKDCQAKTTIRTITNLKMKPNGSFIIIDITANAFLHNMVRNIVGALVEIGQRKQPTEWIRKLRDCTMTKPVKGISTAPAEGLYLMKVFYPKNFILPQRVNGMEI